MGPIKSMWETQGELFLEGIRNQVLVIRRLLERDQTLTFEVSYSDGTEHFTIENVGLASNTMAVLYARDAKQNQCQVVGGIQSVHLVFRIFKTDQPKKDFGFKVEGL